MTLALLESISIPLLMTMNPKKCVFEIFLGKLLGFIVSKRRIEIDPNKAKAIAKISPPKNIKELRGLIG